MLLSAAYMRGVVVIDVLESMVKRAGGHDFLFDEDGYYSLACMDKAVCRISKQTENASISLFNNKVGIGSEDESFARMARIDNKILVVPHLGNSLYIIEVENGIANKIDIDIQLEKYQGKYRFWQVVSHENKFYVMGYAVPMIIRIDPNTYEYELITSWVDEYIKRAGCGVDAIDYFFSDGYAQIGDDFFFPTSLKDTLFKANFVNDMYCFITVCSSICKTLGMAGDGEDIWMTEFSKESSKYAVWNTKNNTVNHGFLPHGSFYYDMAFFGDYAYFFPLGKGGRIYRIEKSSQRIEIASELDALLEPPESDNRIFDIAVAKQILDEIVFVRRPDYTWFSYNFVTKDVKENVYYIEDCNELKGLMNHYYGKMYNNLSSNRGYVNEGQMSLTAFTDYLQL